MPSRKTREAPSQRATLKQAPKRAHYDKQTIHTVLDQAVIASVAVSIDNEPFVLPMAIARIDDAVYLHGSSTSRLMRHLAAGYALCLNVTHLDGIVVARSAMHCSANYRSLVVHGKGQVVEGEDKARLLHQITTRIIPGSEGDYRDHLPKELKATTLIKVPLDEAACKIRSGGPIDDKADLELPYWAGVIPVQQVYGEPLASQDLHESIELPDYARHYQRPGQEKA